MAGAGEPPDPPEAAEPRVGHKIGPYRLVKLLGEGTSGRVFEVEHVKIGRRAAMKTLTGEHAASPGAIKRLFTEALAVNRINNPHIVEVTDIVEKGEHHLVHNGRESLSSLKVNALVMELLEGQSLAQAMVGEGPMPPDRFLPILAQVAEALAAAHAAGFIHRDLKPENIFLTERGGQPDYVKLLDFGLTKTVDGGRAGLVAAAGVIDVNSYATLDGTFLGTPAYASPEQASGKPVDHRTDIYALGVILYELCCGRLPFEGQSVGDYIIKHLTLPAPSLPEEIQATRLGRALEAIIQRCLDKDPAARFPSAAQLADLFAALARGEAVQFTAMQSYMRASTRSGRAARAAARVSLGLGAGLVVAVVALAASGRLTGKLGFPRNLAIREPSPFRAPAGEPARAPNDVRIIFESDPPGAEARLLDDGAGAGGGRGEALGVTPFNHRFPRRDGTVAIELTRPGYEPLRISASTAASGTVSVSLRAAAPPAHHGPRSARGPGAPGHGPAGNGDSAATIDPFK